MANAYVVKPDTEFLGGVLFNGGEDLKKCFQCATCSVVCDLSKGRSPFPRKEMIWAQWGLKDKLMADPDIWVCHQCNDCSTECPRGARPGDVLAAVRRQSVLHYAAPKFLARWVNRVGFLPLMLLIPALLIGAALLIRGPVGEAIGFHEHPGFYADFIPHWLLIGFYSFFTGLATLGAVVGVLRFWKAAKAADAANGNGKPVLGLVPSIIRTLKSIFTHDKAGSCTAQKPRRLTHLLAFYGFVALFVVTVWAVIDIYFNPIIGIKSLYPFALHHPMKILANLGAIFLIAGCIKAIRDRSRSKEGAVASTSFDWMFVGMLLAVGITGVITEIFRFAVGAEPSAGMQSVAYGVYFVHLVLVFDLLVYLPYSKFAHLVYRTVALVYAEHTGRNSEAMEGAA